MKYTFDGDIEGILGYTVSYHSYQCILPTVVPAGHGSQFGVKFDLQSDPKPTSSRQLGTKTTWLGKKATDFRLQVDFLHVKSGQTQQAERKFQDIIENSVS